MANLKRLAWSSAAALVLLAISSAPAAASTAASSPGTPANGGSIGLRLLDEPAAAGSDPRARLYVIDRLAPGSVVHRQIEVDNTTTHTAHVLLYSAAATIANGSFLGAAGHTANEVSTWISNRPASPDVPAGGHASATVTIAVPADAAPGERYGVVWAQISSPPVPGGGVIQVSRVGIRLYVSVGPGAAPASNFVIESLTAERSATGQPLVLATVHNTGGRALDMYGTLRLRSGPSGLSAGPFPATLGTTLAIGDTETVTVVLGRQLPAGPWDAQMTLHSGLLTRTAFATITLPATGAAAPVTITSGDHNRRRVLLAGFAVLLLITVATTLMARWRRRRHKRRPRSAVGTGGRLSETAGCDVP